MELTPEIKQQLAEQKKQCVFCKLISGEMPGAKKVFEDDKTIALLDIYPVVKGHTVFMLKEHYPMPAYIPGDEFKHMFSLIPGLSKSLKSAMVRTGMNVFVAIGGAAGQQAGHFMVHLLPREEEDGFFNFLFNKKGEDLDEQGTKMLQQNFPIMMKNHFGRNPASWHQGDGEIPSFLENVYNNSTILYQDEKILTVIPENSITKGHLVVHSKNEEKDVAKLSQKDSSHMFFAASLASTAVFEGLQAHASNIILKSGMSDDNTEGKLEIHILPRWQEDHLQNLMWQPKQASYDVEPIAKKVKDKTWNVKYGGEEVKEVVIETKKTFNSVEEEIRKAIEDLQ